MEEKTSCLFFWGVELELKTSASVKVQIMSRKAGAVTHEKQKIMTTRCGFTSR